MAINWQIEKNFSKGVPFHKKNQSVLPEDRLTIIMTKQQKTAVRAYCKSQGLELSAFMRSLIAEYFSKINYDLPGDQAEDKNQLKIFPDEKEG